MSTISDARVARATRPFRRLSARLQRMPGEWSELRTTPGAGGRQESETLELWLFNAPEQLLQELDAAHPGVYVIHNDAPRPRSAVDDLRDSFDWTGWKAEGVNASTVGPTEDGYLQLGVADDVETAQKKLDEAYGVNVVRVTQRGPIVATGAASRPP